MGIPLEIIEYTWTIVGHSVGNPKQKNLWKFIEKQLKTHLEFLWKSLENTWTIVGHALGNPKQKSLEIHWKQFKTHWEFLWESLKNRRTIVGHSFGNPKQKKPLNIHLKTIANPLRFPLEIVENYLNNHLTFFWKS